MKKNERKPKTQPIGNRPPPRRPPLVAAGLAPEGEGPDKNSQMTIAKSAEGEGKFIRKALHGHIILRIEPNERGKGNVILNEVPESVISAELIKAGIEGILEMLDQGVVTDCPMVDVVVRIVGGSVDGSASYDVPFKMAGIFAIKDAVKKAGWVVIKTP